MINLIEELRWRGMLQDITPETEARMLKGPITGYIGFDPTADSLHIGSLVQIFLLVRLQMAGHTPIALVGGATGMIGDPTGKAEERNLLTEDALVTNVKGIQKQLEKFLDFNAKQNPAQIVNNYNWYKDFSLLDFLRKVGKHLTVNYMMSKDSVTRRMETGLSFTEFSYQLIQGYDFYHLNQHHNCELQMGGSDQWGNITAGTELIRRLQGGDAHAFTIPLVTKADGTKFGKSEAGTNIWLDIQKTSAYQFYQFWLNTGDDEAEKYLRLFTFFTREETESKIEDHRSNPGARQLQRTLAEDITLRVHGQDALDTAVAATDFLFGKGNPQNRSLHAQWFEEVRNVVPGSEIPKDQITGGILLSDLLVQTGAVPSKSELKRLIQGGGLKVNYEKCEQADFALSPQHLLEDTFLIVQKGKKNYFVIKAV